VPQTLGWAACSAAVNQLGFGSAIARGATKGISCDGAASGVDKGAEKAGASPQCNFLFKN